MYVKRDFFDTLQGTAQLEAVLLWGPRQVGKTTLLDQLQLGSKFFLDDLGVRLQAQNDPALLLENAQLPCLIDEAQYAPNLFSEIKLRIDEVRRASVKNAARKKKNGPQYFLTGSNKILLDEKVKESLAGRCHTYVLHGLSVKEIVGAFPETPIKEILFKGGLPELYTRTEISPRDFLNDYIISFVEKDIAVSAGIQKIDEFHTLLRLLAARTGQFINANELAGASGVEQKTVQGWIGVLERCNIVQRITPFYSNLSKRIVKMPKLFFYDVGLCARLQSQANPDTLWGSAQAGSLFENLVFAEIAKTKDNFRLEWDIHSWRTKDQAEIDFILVRANKPTVFLEAKLAIHGARSFDLDREAAKVFPAPHHKIVVTAGGKLAKIDSTTTAVPIAGLGDYLLRLE